MGVKYNGVFDDFIVSIFIVGTVNNKYYNTEHRELTSFRLKKLMINQKFTWMDWRQVAAFV